jgi:hypothetical protein
MAPTVRESAGGILDSVTRLNRDWIIGAMLLLVGFERLGNRLFPDLVTIVPLLVGLGLLGLFFLTRSLGPLVAGGVISGLGLGILVATRGSPDFGAAGFLISLAGGFYLVWILGLMFERREVRWWPVVPGSVLLAAGAVVYAAGLGAQLLRIAVDWWPVVPIITGLYLLLSARLHARFAEEDETSQVPAVPASNAPPRPPDPAPRAPAGSHVPDKLRSTQIGGDSPGSVEHT